MKLKLLFATVLLATTTAMSAQTELTGKVFSTPDATWTPAYVYYDLATVATALGYADKTTLANDLTAAFANESHTIVISNVDNNNAESTNYTANYWRGSFGCFWLNSNNEVVAWDNGNIFWTQTDWNTDQLVIGMGQMAWLNGGTGCSPGNYTARTKLTNGANSVVLRSTLTVLPTNAPTMSGLALGTAGAAWNSSDVTYPLADVATALGYADAASLKTALDNREVEFVAKKADGSWTSTFTSNYTRGSEAGYDYGCYFMDEEGAVVDGWQYWNWNGSAWELKDGAFAHHFDFNDTNITIHLMQGNGGRPAGIYTANVLMIANGTGIELSSSLVINETTVANLNVVAEGTVYVQDKPWTDWWDKNWYSMNAADYCTATGLDAATISTNLSSLLYSYTDTSLTTLNSDAATNTTTAIGFWLKGATGVITPWADGPEFYIDDVYFNADGTFGGSLGEMPNALGVGTHRTAELYLVCGTKAVKLTVVFDVVGDVISEDKTYTPTAASDVTVALTRTIKVGMNTLVLPFSMTQAEVEETFGAGSIVYVPVSFAGTNVTFQTQNGIIANIPCLLKATESSTAEPYILTGRTIENGSPRIDVTNVSMIGSYEAMTTVPKNDDNYIVYQKDGKDALYFVDNDKAKMKGTRAYLHVTTSSSVKSLTLSFDEVPTGIETMINNQLVNGQWYDLSGRHVAQPTKGLYIINGKKVFVK